MNNFDWLDEHSRTPYHCGNHPTATHTESVSSLVCSDTVTLQITIQEGATEELWHTAIGCLVCQASASFICQWAEGQTVASLQNTSEQDYLNQLSLLTPMRQQCALLAFRCLKKVLTSMGAKEADE